ncbi:MAG TPA: nucleotidyl transferase AbiEii/AbiGii toxin family protein [Nostocaceae cyanobacterium]|nr:nucleotidyl transferase AbiEii/AbiGii toxin family protein [Nostocaceae cyanobacterium]
MNNKNQQFEFKIIKVINDFQIIIDYGKLPILLIGAQSRIFIFDKQYQIVGRATTDCDVVVKLDSWERYNLLVSTMTEGENAKFRKGRVIHKFIHIETNLEVDIVPFGGICNENQEIVWPDGNKMSILGLEEAFDNSQVAKIDNVEIRVPTIPCLVGLKLLAWYERKANKDLADIILIIQNYPDDERVFDELADELIEGKFEFDESVVVMLGRDIYQVFREKSLKRLKETVNYIIERQNQFLPQFISKNQDGDEWDQDFEKLVKLFLALQYGLK